GGDKDNYDKRRYLFPGRRIGHLTVKISLVVSNGKPTLLGTFLFWLKIGPCPPECDKKDLTHAIRSTFGGILPYKSRVRCLKAITIKDCNDTPNESKELSKNDLPFFLALKAESNLIRKVSMWRGVTMKKSMPQCYYLGRSNEGREGNTNFDTVQGKKWTLTKENLGIREIKTNLN
ncbi:hypothetical protein Godav_012094, partial [Gossypium davidsonii]|nr:hypothetical protein [Gossypium davidsonii]